MMGHVRFAGVCAAVALLAGCSLLDKEPEPQQDIGHAPIVAPPPPDPTPDFPRPPVKPASIPEPPAEPANPFPAIRSLSDLIGKSEAEVYVLLGPASGRREETTATVLEYEFGQCSLDLFLYMDMENKVFRTLAYDVKGSGDRKERDDNCKAILQGELDE